MNITCIETSGATVYRVDMTDEYEGMDEQQREAFDSVWFNAQAEMLDRLRGDLARMKHGMGCSRDDGKAGK